MPRRHHHALHGVEAAGVHGRSVPSGGNAVCGGEADIHAGLGVGDPLHERVVGHGEGELIRDLKDQKFEVEEKGEELKRQNFEIL